MIKKSITIGIILLFLFFNVSFTTLSDENSVNLSGKTLYVGGSGYGNYTRIQDAIDNASDGDTVFVYSGTYYLLDEDNIEDYILINKSIELRGESKDETIISSNFFSLYVATSNVDISNFTFINCILYCKPEKNNENLYNIKIINNRIKCFAGLDIWYCINVTVKSNNISPCMGEGEGIYGIAAILSSEVNIENNKISGYRTGILCMDGCIIRNNLIQDNEFGIKISVDTSSSSPCVVRNNNFTDNKIHAFFNLYYYSIFTNYVSSVCKYDWIKDCKLKNNQVQKSILLFRNFYWQKNYWDDWIGFGPKLISGAMELPTFPMTYTFPWFNFDWHPAKEPYDIPVPEV